MRKTHYIFLNGEKFDVSEEVYNKYNRSRRYEEYFMYEKKTGKIIVEEEKVIRTRFSVNVCNNKVLTIFDYKIIKNVID